jgi:hypothetical protein
MITDRDILGTAKLVIDGYGDDAQEEAARRADQLLAKGDLYGYVVWVRILEAVMAMETYGYVGESAAETNDETGDA